MPVVTNSDRYTFTKMRFCKTSRHSFVFVLLIVSSVILSSALFKYVYTQLTPTAVLKIHVQHGTHSVLPSQRLSVLSRAKPFKLLQQIHDESHNTPARYGLYRKTLAQCSYEPNPFTNHIRVSNTQHNIYVTPLDESPNPGLGLFNPTIIPLPSWSPGARYILVSRVVTEGLHQESLICLADFCMPPTEVPFPADIKPCPENYSERLGLDGGLYCVTPSQKLNIPPTPAKNCTGAWAAFPDIPGFHDPRIFWSGKGEPLIIVNSASTYGCVGLWIVDLRAIFPDLRELLHRGAQKSEPMMSYPHLTEITRSPRKSRNEVEKNWILWFPNRREAWLQYDLTRSRQHRNKQQHRHESNTFGSNMTKAPNIHTGMNTDSPVLAQFNDTINNSGDLQIREQGSKRQNTGRTFAQLIGSGLTTSNLTLPLESSCFDDEIHSFDNLNNTGHFHQATPALRLILCTRAQVPSGRCSGDLIAQGKSIHFTIVHRKFSNEMELPLRYERFVVVWEDRWPFRIIGVSKWPILLANEKANPWSEKQNWPHVRNQNRSVMIKRLQTDPLVDQGTVSISTSTSRDRRTAYFTYTPSLAWAWRPKNMQLPHPDHSTLNQNGNNGREKYPDEIDDEDVDHLSGLGIGYLGDEVLLGIGLDDAEQVVSRIRVDDLLQCLRFCPDMEFKSDS